MIRHGLLLAGLLTWGQAANDGWDRLEESLRFASDGGLFHAQLEGLLSLDAYHGAQENPGFVFGHDATLLQPRCTLFADAQLGHRVTGFVQVRADRGFDPAEQNLEFRFDEYAVRLALGEGTACQIQAGKFSMMLGNWVQRHDAWQNAFINAPLPYEYMTGVYDSAAPTAVTDLLIEADEDLYEYNPILWGPGYGTGVAVTGRVGRFEYAAELKNTGPSSRPESWSLSATSFTLPAVNLRLGFRPDLRCRLGVSFSESTFLRPQAAATLPPGRRLGEYRERLLAQDFSYEWHHLQFWAELFEAEFVVPGLPRVWTVAGYAEVRYKFTPQLAGALRWNRQVFSSVTVAGRRQPWGADLSRLDAAVSYRFNPHAQLKLQASALAPASGPGHAGVAYAAQFALRF